MVRRCHIRACLAATVLFLSSTAAPALAKQLKVGVAGAPPFVIRDGTDWSGISLDVWRSIAAENNLTYKLIQQQTPDLGIKAVESEDIDVLIGPISITSTRLAIPDVNFTQPYFFAKAGVILPAKPPTIFSRFRVFFGRAVISSVFVLIGVLLVVGILVWLAERRRNTDNFPEALIPGIGNGMWFALVTLTTVGYGDKAPVTRTGRTITAIWMVISLIAVSSLTASLASAFTLFLSGTAESPITSPIELINRKVAVIKGTSAVELAQIGGMQPVPTSSLESAVEMLLDESVSAVIFDRPALRYYLKSNLDQAKGLRLAPFTLAEETYGFAFKTGSELNTPLDVSILKMQSSGLVETLTNKSLN